MTEEFDLKPLESFFSLVPGVLSPFGAGHNDEGLWWFKFTIDIEHPLAWNVVQELGHVLNYISIEERLPTVFMPVSPPPYLNGGPREFLSWVIESTSADFSPKSAAEWLQARLPEPVDDVSEWNWEDED